MPRTKNVSRANRPASPSDELDEFASDHSPSLHPSASPSSLGVFSANSPSPQHSHSSHRPRSPSPPVDPEYGELAAKIVAQTILKEKPFPLTPHTNPFVRQPFHLQLTNLAQPRTSGNLTFVRQFYLNARYSNTVGINFLGVTIPRAFNFIAIREHYHLPPTPSCHYAALINEYPWDDVLRTLCPEGAEWYQPRGGQRYIRRSDLRSEARPWLHFICNNILPTHHLAMVPKEQALYIYLLMVGRPINLAHAITSALRQCILSTNVKHSLIFPHLITDMFRAYRVPDHPADLTFEPAPAFIYVRLQTPRHLRPPPPPQPAPSSPSSSASPPTPPPMATSPLPSPPAPQLLPNIPRLRLARTSLLRLPLHPSIIRLPFSKITFSTLRTSSPMTADSIAPCSH